jgi:hypothetical protein
MTPQKHVNICPMQTPGIWGVFIGHRKDCYRSREEAITAYNSELDRARREVAAAQERLRLLQDVWISAS